MRKEDALIPGGPVSYVKYDADGNILQTGRTMRTTFDVKVARGELIVEGEADPAQHKVVDGKIKKRLKREITAREKEDEKVLATHAADAADVVTHEELIDAIIQLAAGDSSMVDAIALRRKRQIRKAEKSGADTGGPAQRSAGRDKAASK